MAEFKDKQGRLWHPKLNIDASDRFELAMGESFFSLAHRLGPQDMAASTRFGVPLLWACVDAEAKQRAMGYTDFREALNDGDVLTKAVIALGQAIADFFPTTGAAKKAAKKRAPRKRKPRAVPGSGKTSGGSQPSQASGIPDG